MALSTTNFHEILLSGLINVSAVYFILPSTTLCVGNIWWTSELKRVKMPYRGNRLAFFLLWNRFRILVIPVFQLFLQDEILFTIIVEKHFF